MKRTKLILFFSFFCCFYYSNVWADNLDKALELYQQGNLGESLNYFKLALTGGKNNTAQLKTIYLHIGILEAGTGQNQSAESSFMKLLLLDPEATPPQDVSPRIIERMEAAKASLGSKRMNIILNGPERIEPNTNNSVVIEIQNDIGQLANKVILLINGEEIVSRRSSPRVELPIPASSVSNLREGQSLTYAVHVTDEYGNVIWSSPSTVVPVIMPRRDQEGGVLITSIEGGEVEGPVAQPTPVYKKWWFWTVIGAGVVLVGGGITAGILLSEPGIEYEINSITSN